MAGTAGLVPGSGVGASVGLPAGWVGELGYTPPLSINGAKAHDLFDLAIGHRLVTHGNLTLSLRAFGQHGSVQGDITSCNEFLVAPVGGLAGPGALAAGGDPVLAGPVSWARPASAY